MELLIDEKDGLRKSWAVPRALFGAFPGRVTYVIGKDGKCIEVYDDLAKAEVHPDKALAAL
jgi:peroxiredoxin